MNMQFAEWLKEIARDKRHLKINNGWGTPEREFIFYTKDEVEKEFNEIPKTHEFKTQLGRGVLINTIDLYCDEELTSVLFPWNYILPDVYGTAMGSLKRRSFISNRTLLLHYITTGNMEFYHKDKSINKSIFPDGINPLNDTMVFIPTESYNNMIRDKKDLLF